MFRKFMIAITVVLGFIAIPTAANAAPTSYKVNLNKVCTSEYANATSAKLYQHNAYGWSCVTRGQTKLGPLDIQRWCAATHSGSTAHYRKFDSPGSWFCDL